MNLWTRVLLMLGVVVSVSAARAEPERGDVIVYGATPAGVCAAIAAAREGVSVLLLEPTAHVGGVNTGGLCFSDSNQTVRSTVMGLFDEWHTRIERDYGQRGVTLPYQVAVKDGSRWTYEPHVASKITRQMLEEAGVRVLTGQVLHKVDKLGPTIRSLVTGGGEFTGSCFVDASYEGDLLAAAGVSWTIGRESRKAYGESLAGKQYAKPKMEISGRDGQGRLLPLLTGEDPGPDDEGDRNVMVYSFRLCLTKDSANRVPFPPPAHYDPGKFEVVRRYFQQETKPVLLWDLYPLPGNKLDANNGIWKQFSMGLVGAGNGWCEAGAAERVGIWESHRQYTLELYHFLTTDPVVPQALREELAALGLCRDEFPETGHWSPQLYVREGRRMQGPYVLSQKDVLESSEKPDAIVVSSFPIDSHDCQRVALPEGGVINEGTIYPVRMNGRGHGYPYQVPYRCLLPREEECDNLLVPVALSATHVAYSSIRVEPTWMILGQSAGIAAALCIKEKVPTQGLAYPVLRERLLAQGQVLDLPVLPELPPQGLARRGVDPVTLPGLVLDDSTAEAKGPWSHSRNFAPHVGNGYLHDNRRGDGQSSVIFRFKVPENGRYEVRIAYSAHETRAKAVPVTIQCGSRTFSMTVDETQALPLGEMFRRIGEVALEKDLESTITIANRDTDGFVIVDALQLLPLK